MNIQVLLIAGQHFVQASVGTEGKRFLDVLNDKGSEYLKLGDNRVSWSHAPEQWLGEWPRGLLAKANVSAVIPFETEHEAPQKRHNMMVRKDRHEVILTLPDYEVRGFVHLVTKLGPLEYQAQLVRDGQTFFAVTDVALTHRALPGEPLRAAVALINRQRLGFFQLVEPTTAS